ncbi:hypothetical protein BH18THE2_BH18THE2_20600 [soil metagenome]
MNGRKLYRYIFGHHMIGKPSAMRGKHISEERRRKLIEVNTGRKCSP